MVVGKSPHKMVPGHRISSTVAIIPIFVIVNFIIFTVLIILITALLIRLLKHGLCLMLLSTASTVFKITVFILIFGFKVLVFFLRPSSSRGYYSLSYIIFVFDLTIKCNVN